MTARERIVAALATVEGVTAYPTEPDQKHPGAGWPVLRELNPSEDPTLCDPFARVRTYDVFLVLNGSYAGVSAYEAEDLIERLVDALEPIGTWVPPAQPVQIAFDNQSTMPGLRVRITPDEE